MPDRKQTKPPTAGRRAAGRAESPTSGAGDPGVRRLQRALGNDGLRQQLAQGHSDRTTMLTHLCDRLSVVNTLQQRELGLTQRGATFDWWREAARDDHRLASAPDPSRWHETAQAYKRAASALCSGDLDRGRLLLEHAMTVEDRTYDQMTNLVSTTDLAFDTRPDTAMLDGLVDGGQIGPCEPPKGVALADDILRVDTEAPAVPELIRPLPWWAHEEEEEEEEEAGDDDVGGE